MQNSLDFHIKKFLVVVALLGSSCSQPEKQIETQPEKQSEEIVGEVGIIPKPTSIKRIGGQFILNQATEIVAVNESSIKLSTVLNYFLSQKYGFKLEVTNNPHLVNSITFLNDETGEGLNSTEGYNLKIEPESVQIKGSERGMFYGVQTLIQLLPITFSGEIMIPAADIKDAPRFPYRGMHLDVVRHFMPVEFLKKYIDLMSQYKFNYFHWHLTDDQGWRIEIKNYPKLTEIGSKRTETVVGKNYRPYIGDGIPVENYYTQEQIREIVEFAKVRYITIIPEIDVPGHSSAALAAYPEYGCKNNYDYKVKTMWGAFPDIYCPTESTFHFIEDVLSEVMDLFPDSPYLHIGGDEVDTKHWKESDFVQKLKLRENLKDENDVQSWFIKRIENFANSRGKKIIGWDEINRENTASTNSVIMSWHGADAGIKAVRTGHQVIMTPSNTTYFDHPQSNEKTEPLGLGKQLTLEDVYEFEPVPANLNAEEASYIIGGQGCVWTEFMKKPANVEYMVFPRAIALAEVLWSINREKDFNEFSKRLEKKFPKLYQENVNYRSQKPFNRQNRESETVNQQSSEQVNKRLNNKKWLVK